MLRGFLLRLLYPRPVRTDFSLLNGGTSSFFAQHFNEVLLSPDPHAEMHRYTIESIALNVQTPQFEHLIVTVSDAQRTTSPNTGLLCIKCTASDEYITEYFSEHSESRNVLDAIISALEDSTLPSASPFSHQPSIDPTPTPSSTLDSESGPPPSPASQPTLVDPAPGTSTHTFYRSLASVTEQNDTKNFGHEQVVRRIKPKGLYLFELALLADVVHKQDRLYSLFQNQRYWYANLICDAVVALYTCKEQDNRGNAYCQDGVYIPPNNYLPKLAGQWKRIPVSDVEAAVLSVVLARFEGVRTQRIDAVYNEVRKRADEKRRLENCLRKNEDLIAKLHKIEARAQQQVDAVSNGVISALDEEEIELAMKEARQIYAELEEELKSLKKQIGHSAIIY